MIYSAILVDKDGKRRVEVVTTRFIMNLEKRPKVLPDDYHLQTLRKYYAKKHNLTLCGMMILECRRTEDFSYKKLERLINREDNVRQFLNKLAQDAILMGTPVTPK